MFSYYSNSFKKNYYLSIYKMQNSSSTESDKVVPLLIINRYTYSIAESEEFNEKNNIYSIF